MVQHSCDEIARAYETEKQKAVKLTRDTCSPEVARVVEKIIGAIPEIFVALSSLLGGVLTIPALAISWGRKMVPMCPMMETALRGDFSSKGIGDSIILSMKNFDELFERAIVPSLLVAFTVDAVYSFAIGWIASDFGLMLHGTAIALPGACLALRHLMQQNEREAPSTSSREAVALSL